MLGRIGRRLRKTFQAPVRTDSADLTPWAHPFVTVDNLTRVRAYAEAVWNFATDYARKHPEPLNLGFAVNLVQTAYKWACLTRQYGAQATLYPHPHDHNAQSMPEWEEFDGDFPNVHDGDGFLAAHCAIPLRCPCIRVPFDVKPLLEAEASTGQWDRRALRRAIGYPPRDMRWESFLAYPDYRPYFPLAQALATHDALVAPSLPIPAYLSGRPYLAQSVGGDLKYDCGRADEYGLLMTLSFTSARFITFTNPMTVAYCRRLGFTNGLYLPYLMDDDRYCPGEGQARRGWVAEHGEGVYVLSTARLDNTIKGNAENLLDALVRAAAQCPALRYVFLQWGQSAEAFVAQANASGVGRQFIFLKPVGKVRLIDYLRSCDAVLDQFVYGYYGATALEAAAIGKPVLMHMRAEQYAPFYRGDVAPVVNVAGADELPRALVELVEKPDRRRRLGEELRAWLVRNHGAARMVPILLGLARLAANQIPLPPGLDNPLLDVESEAETRYHKACEFVRPPA